MESQPTVLQSIFETSAETSPRVTLQQYQNLFQNLYPLDVSGVDLHRRCGTILRVPPSPADTSVAYADMDDPEVMEEHAARSSSLPASIADIDDPEVVPMRGAHASSYQPASKRRRFETMSCTADNQTRSATVTAELEDLELLLHETFDQNNDRLPYAGNLGAADVLAQVGQNPVLAELESPSAASSLAGIEVAAHNMIGNCTKGNLSKVDKTSVSRIPHKRGSTPRSQSSAWMAAVTQGDKRTWTPIPMKPQAVASFLDDLQEVLDIMDGETRHVTRNTPLVYEIDSVDPRSQTNSQSHVPLSDGIAIETDHAIPSLGGSFCLDEPHLEIPNNWSDYLHGLGETASIGEPLISTSRGVVEEQHFETSGGISGYSDRQQHQGNGEVNECTSGDRLIKEREHVVDNCPSSMQQSSGGAAVSSVGIRKAGAKDPDCVGSDAIMFQPQLAGDDGTYIPREAEVARACWPESDTCANSVVSKNFKPAESAPLRCMCTPAMSLVKDRESMVVSSVECQRHQALVPPLSSQSVSSTKVSNLLSPNIHSPAEFAPVGQSVPSERVHFHQDVSAHYPEFGSMGVWPSVGAVDDSAPCNGAAVSNCSTAISACDMNPGPAISYSNENVACCGVSRADDNCITSPWQQLEEAAETLSSESTSLERFTKIQRSEI